MNVMRRKADWKTRRKAQGKQPLFDAGFDPNQERDENGRWTDTDKVDRPALIAKRKALMEEMRPLAAKGTMTGSEAIKFMGLGNQISEVMFDLVTTKPFTGDKIKTEAERMSTLSKDIVMTAHADTFGNREVFMALSNAAFGTQNAAETEVDKLYRAKPEKLYSRFNATRAALRAKFGDTMKLYRAEGKQMDKPTKNWATTREYAAQFGSNIIERDIPVDDIIAVNVDPVGNYHEVIVAKRPITNDASPEDPSGTAPLQKLAWKDAKRRWQDVEKAVREGLKTYDFTGVGDRVTPFRQWLDSLMAQHVVGSGAWLMGYMKRSADAAGTRARGLVQVGDAGFDPSQPRDKNGQWVAKGDPLDYSDFTPPTKTLKAYKLFRTLKSKPGKLFPTQVDITTEIPMGVWVPAQFKPKEGFKQRPGWHGGTVPMAPQMRNKQGVKQDHLVWGEVEFEADDHEAIQAAANAQPDKMLGKTIPKGGYYKFHPGHKNYRDSWVISGGMKVNRLLSDDEVYKILMKSGYPDDAKAEAPKRMSHDAYVDVSEDYSIDWMRLLQDAMGAELQGIVQATSQQATRAMANGILKRKDPTKDVLDVLRKVGAARTKMLLNHALMKTFSVATLEAFRSAGVDQVGIIPEKTPHVHVGDAARNTPQPRGKGGKFRKFAKPLSRANRRKAEKQYVLLKELGRVNVLTAEDDRVCETCERIAEQGPYGIDHAMSLVPAHINCRCVFLPVGRLPMTDYDPNQPRDDNGRWTRVGEKGLGAAVEAMRAIADKVADDLGYPKDKIFFSPRDHWFDLAGMRYRAQAIAVTQGIGPIYMDPGGKSFESYNAGDIIVFRSGADGFDKDIDIKGTISHEIEHIKFNKVLEALREERDDWRDMRASERAEYEWDVINTFGKVWEDTNIQMKLVDTDGITDYSKTWWRAFKAPGSKVKLEQAVHETLAEISRLRYEKGDAGETPAWKKLFDAVEKTYRKIEKAEASYTKDFNPYHEPGGSPIGGRFARAPGGEGIEAEGAGEAGGGPVPKYHQPDQRVFDVGGDTWNKAKATQLELEYVAAKPALIEIEQNAVGNVVSATGSAVDWESLPDEIKSNVETKWKENNYDDVFNSEVENWHDGENDVIDAAYQLVVDFEDNGVEEWAYDAIHDMYEQDPDGGPDINPYPFSAGDIITAMKVEYDSGDQKPKIDFDDEVLDKKADIDPNQLMLPGMDPVKGSERLTPQMREELISTLKEAFMSKAQEMAPDMEPPEYIAESAKETLDTVWDDMDNGEKLDFAKNNVIEEDTMIDMEIEEIPSTYNPTQEPGKGDYEATQRMARYMSLVRAQQLIKERLDEDVDMDVVEHMDRALWKSWVDSSTSRLGIAIQAGVADEFDSRFRDAHFKDKIEGDDAKQYAMKIAQQHFGENGYGKVRAMLRAKWETTQFMLEKADLPKINLYRGVNLKQEQIDTTKKEEVRIVKTYPASSSDVDYTKLPEVFIERNGAASSTHSVDVASNWKNMNDAKVTLRAVVPRTAIISVPAYGQNIHKERESVVMGTAWVGWDAWLGAAPKLEDYPLFKENPS